MFSGIIEEVGKVSAVTPIAGGKRFTITAHTITQEVKISDSIAVSGVCLTAVDVNSDKFIVEAVGDTLAKSTFAKLRKGDLVNLERSLRLSDRVGGHFVQGHINGTGQIVKFRPIGENWDLEVKLEPRLMRYVIPEGSIAIDGVSLTVADIGENNIRISVIPYTFKNTTMIYYRPGNLVNIETDFLGKYVEKFLSLKKPVSKISESWLKELGY
jgi:riboflavin synthase